MYLETNILALEAAGSLIRERQIPPGQIREELDEAIVSIRKLLQRLGFISREVSTLMHQVSSWPIAFSVEHRQVTTDTGHSY